jgi:hypothetical protein
MNMYEGGSLGRGSGSSLGSGFRLGLGFYPKPMNSF